jgi:hypothetical protein
MAWCRNVKGKENVRNKHKNLVGNIKGDIREIRQQCNFYMKDSQAYPVNTKECGSVVQKEKCVKNVWKHLKANHSFSESNPVLPRLA